MPRYRTFHVLEDTNPDALAAPPVARPRRRRLIWPLLRWGLKWGLILAVWCTLVGGGAVLWFARDLPRPDSALDAARRPSLAVLDRDGRTVATFGDSVGESLRLADLPPCMPAAAVAIEDRRFWSHPGFDLQGIARAMWTDLRAGRVVQGGSTLTQQVAKTLFLSNARTAGRKVQEALLTLWLERSFSKREILEIWLNRVYLGSGTWGVDAAAHLYFGTSARSLSLWQCAVLAGLPRAPSRFSPRVDPAAAAARARQVLAAMAETGAITAAERDAAATRIAFPPATQASAGSGWFADWAVEQAQPRIPEGADATIATTLDSRLQAIVEARLRALLDGPGAAAGAGQGAVVVLDAATGAVRALAGGREYGAGGYDRAVLARRQPGSAFKPFVWLAALESGLQPQDTVLDAPIRIGDWSPTNFDGTFRGEVTLEDALADSLNTAAVRLLQKAGGPRAVAAVAHRLGIGDRLPDAASLALGTGEVGLLELAGAYAPFFNGGRRVALNGIARIDLAGQPWAASPQVAQPQVVDPVRAAQMARMLAAVVARGSGRAAAVAGRTVAGKTGTTQDYRDAWFVGAVGDAGAAEGAATIVGVWLGNDDGRPMRGVTGGSLPARLFHEIAAALPP